MEVRTRVGIFEDIFLVFLGLGTLVGAVVIAYTLYNAYKYRDNDDAKADDSLPTVGELPTGGKGGKKLFLSFGISAIIVISLVIWTYGMLLVVEDPQENFEDEDPIEIEVTGDSFAWQYEYANGASQYDTMRVPADTPVRIEVTSGDVWHAFGVPDLRVKADAIPGEYDETWFIAEEAGQEHRVQCFELCGDLHSDMTGTVEVMEEEEFNEWLESQLNVEISLEDADEQPVTDGYELELVHENNDEFDEDLQYTYTADDFENGTLETEDIEQGGTYELTITFEDDQYETIEDSIDVTSPVSETYTVEDPDAEDDEENGSDNETDTEDDENASDEETNDGGEN